MGRQHVAYSQDGEFMALLAERNPRKENENKIPFTDLTLLENRQRSWVESEHFKPHLTTGEVSKSFVSAMAFSPTQPQLVLALRPTNFGGGHLIPMKPDALGGKASVVDSSKRKVQKLMLLNFESEKIVELSPNPFEPFADKEVRFISWSHNAKYLTIVSTPNSNGTSSVTILQDGSSEKSDAWRLAHHWEVENLSDVAVSPAENIIALVNQAGVVEVFSMEEKTLLTRIRQDDCSLLMFSPDGTQLACYSENGRLTVYDIESLCTRKKYTTGR